MATPDERKLIEDWLDEENQGQTALKLALFSAVDDDSLWLHDQLGRTAKRIDPQLFEPDAEYTG